MNVRAIFTTFAIHETNTTGASNQNSVLLMAIHFGFITSAPNKALHATLLRNARELGR